jgi:hypothetical protein
MQEDKQQFKVKHEWRQAVQELDTNLIINSQSRYHLDAFYYVLFITALFSLSCAVLTSHTHTHNRTRTRTRHAQVATFA